MTRYLKWSEHLLPLAGIRQDGWRRQVPHGESQDPVLGRLVRDRR